MTRQPQQLSLPCAGSSATATAQFINIKPKGQTWRRYGITSGQVRQRMAPVAAGAPEIWSLVEA